MRHVALPLNFPQSFALDKIKEEPPSYTSGMEQTKLLRCSKNCFAVTMLFLIVLGFDCRLTFAHETENDPDPHGPVCQLLFSEDNSLERYAQAVAQLELSPEILKAADEKYKRSFAGAVLPTQSGQVHIQRLDSGIFRSLFRIFNTAVGRYIAGYNEDAKEYARDMLRTLQAARVGKMEASAPEKLIESVAEDPDIFRPLIMAPYFLKQQQSIESFFMHALKIYPSLKDIFVQANDETIAIGGPAEAEMVRALLQFAPSPRAGDKILEIGYRTPAILLAYSYYVPGAILKGVDSMPLPKPSDLQELRSHNIDLIQGIFPDDDVAHEQVQMSGPYRAIFALNTIKSNRHDRNARLHQTQISWPKFAKSLYDQLEPGGVLIILNDLSRDVPFEMHQLSDVGFQIVRWYAHRQIPDSLLPFLSYKGHPKKLAGNFSLFVFRRGLPDQSRIEGKQERLHLK